MLLRKRHKDLQGLGVQTIGISVDHLPALCVFDPASAKFPFPLAADWNRGICRAYGVFDEAKQSARRVLMLCDGEQIVRHVVNDFTPEQPEMLDQLIDTARRWQT